MKCQVRKGQIVEIPTEPRVIIDFDRSLGFFHEFYKDHGAKIPRNFAKVFRSLWAKNREQIRQAVETKGFDFLLLGLPVKSLPALDEQMVGKGNRTYFGVGSGGIQENPLVKSPRLVLMYREPNLLNHSILKETLGQPASSFLRRGVLTTFSDYRVYIEVIWEQDKIRPDAWGWTWLPGSKAGSNILRTCWNPGGVRVNVDADSPGSSYDIVGCRLSHCFWC